MHRHFMSEPPWVHLTPTRPFLVPVICFHLPVVWRNTKGCAGVDVIKSALLKRVVTRMLVVTGASLVVTSALLVVTRSY